MHFDTLSEAIEPLIADELIGDVLYPVKSGKEATLYCCSGGSRAPAGFVAVKVYKPQRYRSFRNDSIYQEGRIIMNDRDRRAAAKRTRHGREVQSSLWTNSEYETLRTLYRAGAGVPKPLGHTAGAVAMEWIGDEDGPAPQLKDVSLGFSDASVLFGQVIADIELWLACNVIHGDLSAYNILVDGDRAVTIDFPQAIDPRVNPNAETLLTRDVQHVCQHFARHGVHSDAYAIADDLWDRFTRSAL